MDKVGVCVEGCTFVYRHLWTCYSRCSGVFCCKTYHLASHTDVLITEYRQTDGETNDSIMPVDGIGSVHCVENCTRSLPTAERQLVSYARLSRPRNAC